MLACLLAIQFASSSLKNVISFSTSRPAPEVIEPEFVALRKSQNLEFDSSNGDENGFPTGTSTEAFTEVSNSPLTSRSSKKGQTII